MQRVLLGGILMIGLSGPAGAQLLNVSPLFPADSTSITVTLDCSRGNQGLLNYSNTSDVYVHTGVITSLSTSSTDWRYVKFNQNFNLPNSALQASYMGNQQYSYSIPNIRTYYGVPGGETILKVAILFRNGNGSSVQRNSDGSDMFLSVYGSGLATQFLLPPFQPVFTPIPEPIRLQVGDSLPVHYVSNHSGLFTLYFNGVRMDSVYGNGVSDKMPIMTSGNQQVKAVANDGINQSADSLQFYVSGPTHIQPLPAGVAEGINYLPGDTSVVLVIYAPHKNKMVVVGDFNNWIQDTAFQMNRTPDSTSFWLQLTGLKPGQEYAYQYVVDDSIIVADYNTEKVLDKNVDPQIPAATYPGLKTFPAQASGTLASVLQTARPAYSWQTGSFQRPNKNNLIIYELLVRDFTGARNWQTLKDTLSYLKRLGVNAVELMPFNNFEGYSSWGYNPNFYFAPDKVYGTETALKQFIDACHAQGIAVIMDMVLNHSFGSSPMVQLYWDPVNHVPASNNPWFNAYTTHAFNVGYQFNHESPATKEFTQRILAYWLGNYHLDGFRFDLAKGFTQKRTCDALGNNCDVNAWGAYDSSRVAIWDTIYNQQQAIAPRSYCILEMFAGNSEEKVEAHTGMMLWGNLNYNFNQATMGYNTGWDFSGGIYSSLGWDQPNLITYQESHDEERLMYKNEAYGNSSGQYMVKNIPTGLKRNAMAAAFWAMIPGPKMLWEFGELGYDSSINTCANGTVDASGNCRLDPKPVPWNFYQDLNRLALYKTYARLFQLRSTPDFLQTFIAGTVSKDLSGPVKWMSVTGDSLQLMVIGNFDVIPGSTMVSFPASGTWYSYLTDSVIHLNSASTLMNLQAGEFYVFTSRDLRLPVDSSQPGPPVSALFVKIQPNPVTAATVVLAGLPEDGMINLDIVDFQGRRLSPIFSGFKPKGTYRIPLYGSGLPGGRLAPGVYVLQLNQNGHRATTRLVVIH